MINRPPEYLGCAECDNFKPKSEYTNDFEVCDDCFHMWLLTDPTPQATEELSHERKASLPAHHEDGTKPKAG